MNVQLQYIAYVLLWQQLILHEINDLEGQVHEIIRLLEPAPELSDFTGRFFELAKSDQLDYQSLHKMINETLEFLKRLEEYKPG